MRNSTRKAMPDKFRAAFLHPKYWPVWAGIGLLRIIACLPHTWKLRLGTPLGHLLYWLAPRRRKTALSNIQLAFPHWSTEKQQALLKAHFESLGISLMEQLITWWGGFRSGKPEKELALFKVYGLENIRNCLKKEQGVILLVPHFTHIDLTGLAMMLHFSIKPVYRPHDDPFLEFLIKQGRTVSHSNTFHVEPISKYQTRTMLKHLKKGGLLFYLPDQKYTDKGHITVDFFNHPAPSNPATSKLAQLAGAAVVPVFTCRIGNHYHVTCLPALENFPSGDDAADLIRLHQLYEQEIRANPAQYLWVHDRWNLKP